MWEDLTVSEKARMRQQDIAKATKKLEAQGGGKLPNGYTDLGNGQISVDGVIHTWHHDHKKGVMQLIPTELHQNSQNSDFGGGTHIGMSLWHRQL